VADTPGCGSRACGRCCRHLPCWGLPGLREIWASKLLTGGGLGGQLLAAIGKGLHQEQFSGTDLER
jgi:hypothetical protein